VSVAEILETSSGTLSLSGVLDFRSGPQLRVNGQKLIRQSQASALLLDCSAVDKSSSVGVALLLAFMRDAAAAGKKLSIVGLPSDMQQIAQVSGLDDLLPLQA
jgi:phospholipid transport system transporter-binding protein